MNAAEMLDRYEGVARNAVRGMYVDGYDRDDLLQEARIGLIEAFGVWDRARPFAPIAATAARRRVFDVLNRSLWMKRGAGESPMSLSTPSAFVAGVTVEDAVADHGSVSDDALRRLRLRALLNSLPSLTALERRAVIGVAAGYTYAEIGGGKKKIDNAVQRGRAKLRAAA